MAAKISLWLLLSVTWIYSSQIYGLEVLLCDSMLASDYAPCSQDTCGSSGKCYMNCVNTSTNDSAVCNPNATDDVVECQTVDCFNSTSSDMTGESDTILTLPRNTFIIIVAAGGGVVILGVVILICLCCCCCCMRRRNKHRIENLKQQLIEQPEVDRSPSRASNLTVTSPFKKASIPVDTTEPIHMQANRALKQESSDAPPPSSVSELLPMSKNSFSTSKSMDHIRESALSDTGIRPKTDSDAYLKMDAVGTIRPSLSCQDIVDDEEIYVEPDQNMQPCDAAPTANTKSQSMPTTKATRANSKSPKPENPYSNQETIARQSAGSPENDGYQNVVPPPMSPKDESYTTVNEFLGQTVRNIEDEEEEEDRQYYNYIPREDGGDEMYVYMQTGIASTNGNPASDQDRVRGPLKPNQSVKYVNLSKQDINLRLPGSEYREPDGSSNAGNEAASKEQPIYANYEEGGEELYAEMS